MTDETQYERDLEQAKRRVATATRAFHELRGAERVASDNGDTEWLREIRDAFPRVGAEQRDASRALWELVMAAPHPFDVASGARVA